MSSSSNSPIVDAARLTAGQAQRRTLMLALAISPLPGLHTWASASTEALAGLRRWGSGEFRRFGFLVYEATLWAGEDPQRPPLALRLDYRRAIEGKVIADASVNEMRRFVSDPALLRRWGEQMQRIFPDVKPGEHLLGLHRGDEARFYQGEHLIGAIGEPGFAHAFFAIWLDARTSEPALRAALLRRKEA